MDSYNLHLNEEDYFQKNRNAIEEVDEYASDICKVILVFNKMDKINDPSSSSITKILDLLPTLKHDMITVKCSAATGDGLSKLSQSISSIHKVISLWISTNIKSSLCLLPKNSYILHLFD